MTQIDDMITVLQKLAKVGAVGSEVAEKMVEPLKTTLAHSLQAGESPEGEKWADRKAGGRAYANAAKALSVAASGALLIATIKGVEAFGHFGRGKQQVRRPMLPDAGGGIPSSVNDALQKVAADYFAEVTK